MAFNNYGVNNTTEGRKSDIDFNALNKYVVETAALETAEVLVGVVTGIVDLGIQENEDAEMPFTGTAEDEADAIDDKPLTYFKDGIDPVTKKPVRLKCWPQKATQAVALAIDFPEILLDKGQFFNDKTGRELPLRLWLGGSFYDNHSKQMKIARPTALKIGKNTKGQWSFNSKHLLYKMAVASKTIAPDSVFLPQDIDKLIGKAFQFEAQVYMKKGKDNKEYYTEKVAFKSGLGRGQEAPDLPTDTFIVQFNEPNDEKMLKELRSHVINTIRAAKNYDGSPIQKQLEAAKSYSKSEDEDTDDVSGDEAQEAPPVVAKPTRTARKPKVEPEDDSGSPF